MQTQWQFQGPLSSSALFEVFGELRRHEFDPVNVATDAAVLSTYLAKKLKVAKPDAGEAAVTGSYVSQG